MVKKKIFVKDYMTKNVISVSSDAETAEVMYLMKKSHHSSFPVVDGDKLVGLISTFDLIVKEWHETVSAMMQTNIVVANQDLDVNHAFRVMSKHGTSKMPVVNDEGKLVGIITSTDIARLVLSML